MHGVGKQTKLNKKCSKCGCLEPETDFNFKNIAKGIRGSWCKKCYKAANKLHYERNKGEYIDRANHSRLRYRRVNLENLYNFFKEHPCIDCGENDPRILEFDHQGEKLFNISRKINCLNWESLLKEINKCEVRCANCHRKKTLKEIDALRSYMV